MPHTPSCTITVVLGSINFELRWMGMSWEWRGQFPTVSWWLTKTCIETYRAALGFCLHYRMPQWHTVGLCCLGCHFWMPLVVINTNLHHCDAQSTFCEQFSCRVSCAILDLPFNKIMIGSIRHVFLWIFFKLTEHFLGQLRLPGLSPIEHI